LRPEDYDKLGSEDVKAIVDKFISKIKMAIYKLKSAKGKNIYCASNISIMQLQRLCVSTMLERNWG
jgi:hypothetical protein